MARSTFASPQHPVLTAYVARHGLDPSAFLADGSLSLIFDATYRVQVSRTGVCVCVCVCVCVSVMCVVCAARCIKTLGFSTHLSCLGHWPPPMHVADL